MTYHALEIISLHDAQAGCSCGGWHYSVTGEKTREEIFREWEKHRSWATDRKNRKKEAGQ
jgi:hypothetical protein